MMYFEISLVLTFIGEDDVRLKMSFLFVVELDLLTVGLKDIHFLKG